MFQSFLFWIKRFDTQLSQPSTFLFNFIHHGYRFYLASASWADTSQGKTIVTACYTPHRPLLYKTSLLPLGYHEEVLLLTIMMKYTHYSIGAKIYHITSHSIRNILRIIALPFVIFICLLAYFISISFAITIIRRLLQQSLDSKYSRASQFSEPEHQLSPMILVVHAK